MAASSSTRGTIALPSHFHPCEVCRIPVVCTEPCREDEYQEMAWCDKHKKHKKKKGILVDLRRAYERL